MKKDDKHFSVVVNNDDLAAKVLTEFEVRDLKDKGECDITTGKCNVTLSKDKGEIEVKADDGTVVFLGEVASNETKEAIEEAAYAIKEVLRIDNQVKVRV